MRKQRLRKQQSARRRDQHRASAALGAIDERAPEEGDTARRAPSSPDESETTCVVSIGAPSAARLANAAAPVTMLQRVVSRERAASDASSSERDAKARRDPRLAFRSVLRVASGEEPDATLGALSNDALPGGALKKPTPKPAAVSTQPGSGSWTPAFARNRAAHRSGEGVAALEIRRGVAFCGREDGVIAVRPFFPDERKQNPSSSSADEKRRSPLSTPYAAQDVHQDVPPPSEWNGAAGAVRFLRAFPAEEEEELARRRERNAPEENTSSLFAAYDNGSWARFVPDPLDGWVVSSCAPGPHPDFADVFKLRPARERSRWANRRAKIGAACLDAAGRELFLASPVLGESCVYRWILPSATTARSATTAALARRSLAGGKKNETRGDGGGGGVAPEDALAGPPSAPAASEASSSPSGPPRRRRESWETLKASTWGDVQRLERHTDAVMCLAPLPGGGFASGGNDARLVAWRPSAEVSEGGGGGGGERGGGSFVSGGVRVVRETKSGGAIRALAISPDATRWFTAGSEGNVRAWDASDLEGRGFVLLRAFRGGHQGFVTSLAILPPRSAPDESDADADAKGAALYVVSGSEGSPGGYWSKGDGAVKVWRVGDGACVCTTPAKQSGDVVAVRPVASRSVLACAASDGTVAEWDVLWPKRRGAQGSAEGDDDITWERGFLR